jgi:hypothetical protein
MIEYQAQMAASATGNGVPLSITHMNGNTTIGNDRAPSALDGLLPAAAWPNSAPASVPQSPLPSSTVNGKEFSSKKDIGTNDQNEEKTNDSAQSPPPARDLSVVLSASPSQAPLTPSSMSPSPSMSSLRPRARPR